MSGKHVFETMNGLRGFAALVVVGFHWSLRDPLNLENGFLAVDLFFVLSGFVIAHSYEERLEIGLPLRDFFIIRLVRLYPLYLFGTLFSILVVAISFLTKGRIIETNVNLFNAIPWALLMLPTPPQNAEWSQASLYPLNIPAWSLLFEILINCIYAMSFRYWTAANIFRFLIFSGLSLISFQFMTNTSFGDCGPNWSNVELGLLRSLVFIPSRCLDL